MTIYADNEIYQYTVILFGLINAGSTFKRIDNKLFTDMVNDTMEMYVDDMLVKYKVGFNHQRDMD